MRVHPLDGDTSLSYRQARSHRIDRTDISSSRWFSEPHQLTHEKRRVQQRAHARPSRVHKIQSCGTRLPPQGQLHLLALLYTLIFPPNGSVQTSNVPGYRTRPTAALKTSFRNPGTLGTRLETSRLRQS